MACIQLGLSPLLLVAILASGPQQLTPGDHLRTMEVAGRQRTFLVHVPESYDAGRPTPLVLVFHGFGADGSTMVRFCRMNAKADKDGFIAAYPYGTGVRVLRLFNGGGARNAVARSLPDDLKFVDALLDELVSVANIDPRRIYATGFSNGAMMCHRLAVERSDRIAAIATVAGTMAKGLPEPKRPVPVLHFHGTADPAFSFQGREDGAAEAFDVLTVDETIRFWAQKHNCLPTPELWDKEDEFDDDTTVRRKSYRTPSGDIPVIFYVIQGAGHNWPGQEPPWFLGTWTREISANDLIWEFFEDHPLGADGTEEEAGETTEEKKEGPPIP